MKYYIILDINWEQKFVRIPFEGDLEVAKEAVEIMLKNPIINVLGIVDEDNDIILQTNDFTGYFDSF
ncbi:hypothetical protein ACTFQL_27620 [Bacillus cereus group sp. MYBK44-1]|uniref:hypothetical protein n=1 Tax=Bacillus cereus group sp. MYBK44-1 TaxID=3450625 RepID=UPI003F79E7F3